MLYKIAVISDFEEKNKKFSEVLSLYFPYHLLSLNKTKFDKYIQKYAKDQRCGSTIIHAVSNERIYTEFLENKVNMFILFWDGKSDDMKFYLKATRRDLIPTFIYYHDTMIDKYEK